MPQWDQPGSTIPSRVAGAVAAPPAGCRGRECRAIARGGRGGRVGRRSGGRGRASRAVRTPPPPAGRGRRAGAEARGRERCSEGLVAGPRRVAAEILLGEVVVGPEGLVGAEAPVDRVVVVAVRLG